MRIRDAIDGFALSLRAARASPSTVRLYRFMLERVATFAEADGRTRLDELTLEVVRKAMLAAMTPPNDREPHPNWKGGEATVYAMGRALRTFSATLRAEGIAVTDFSVLQMRPPPERIQPRLQPEEFRALEAVVLRQLMGSRAPRLLVARDLALLSLMADTGLRAAEICALDVADVDFEYGAITVRRGKGDKPRVLPICDPSERDGGPTLRALADYLSECDRLFGPRRRLRALWLSRRGARLTPGSLRDRLAKLCADAGIEGNRPPHAFRRGYFSDEYRNSPTALPLLRARMGWSPRSHRMVDVYTRGAEIDLAREQVMPSVAKRWREQPSPRTRKPSLTSIAGPPWAQADDAPPPSFGGRDGERAAGQPARGRRSYATRPERA